MEEVQKFRAEVREWLADNLVGEYAALKGLGGPGREDEAFEERRAWNRHLAKAGLTCLGWPVEHGGRGLSVAHRVAFYEEYARADAPDKVNHFGEELLGPTLIAFGSPEQQQRFLPRILDVTELWCQGYSEPNAGSDLANVATTAVLDGDQWVINGQKVWTSMAHLSQWCFVVARTEKGSKRHAGLSYLLVPLDQPGVEVRPIVQLTGSADFNEVFFDDARTDADLVVGAPGDGWRVAMGTLTFERGVSTLGQQIRYARELSGIVELARKNGTIDDPAIRERLDPRLGGTASCARTPWPPWTSTGARGQDSGRSCCGPTGIAAWASWRWTSWAGRHGEAGDVTGGLDEWQRLFLFSRADTIYGGSNEIQRNIIAERVLGLPGARRPMSRARAEEPAGAGCWRARSSW